MIPSKDHPTAKTDMRKHIDPSETLPSPTAPNKAIKNIVGNKFGRLTVMSFAGTSSGRSRWDCRCDCGNTIIVVGGSLISGNTKSCGCFNLEGRRNRKLTHGQHGSPEYNTWGHMIARCERPSCKDFQYYGARGIKVCDRWREFSNFFADMGKKPSPKHSIDRINNNGNYEPSNCYWATHKEQMRNRRTNHLLAFNGQTLCIAAWAEKLHLSKRTIQYRLRLGWAVERVLAP